MSSRVSWPAELVAVRFSTARKFHREILSQEGETEREGGKEREYEVEIFSVQLLTNDYPKTTRFESYCTGINY